MSKTWDSRFMRDSGHGSGLSNKRPFFASSHAERSNAGGHDGSSSSASGSGSNNSSWQGPYHRQRIENTSFYDYRANFGIALQSQLYERDHRDHVGPQPSTAYLFLTSPPRASDNPASAFATVLARNAVMTHRNSAINALAWSNRARWDIATYTHQASGRVEKDVGNAVACCSWW